MDLYAFPGRLSTPAVVTANGTMKISDQWIRFDTGSGDQAIAIPTPVGNAGRIMILEKVDSGLSKVTFTPAAGLIAGAATTAIHTPGETLHLISDGTDWIKTNRYIPSRQASFKSTMSNFGTVLPGMQSFQSWRVGKYLFVKGEFIVDVPAAGGASFTYGFNGLNAPASVVVDSSFYSANIQCGKYTAGTANNRTGNIYCAPGNQQLLLSGVFSADAFNQANANNISSAGDTIRFEANSIPIAGWLD